MCQDVQNLSFGNDSFDLCTSTEVFEHVADNSLSFKNIHRVLKPHGKLIFTIPLSGNETVQRARIQNDDELIYLLPPEYHGDPISDSREILAFRNYGNDILNILTSVGFGNSKIVSPKLFCWGIKRDVIVAQK